MYMKKETHKGVVTEEIEILKVVLYLMVKKEKIPTTRPLIFH
jgi:hypothetical protein